MPPPKRSGRRKQKSPLRYNEEVEKRLLEFRTSVPEGAAPEEVMKEHGYFLDPLLPPESFMAAGPGGEPVPERALLARGLGSVLRTVGCILGGHDAATEQRWQHLAEGEMLREVGSLVVYQWFKPYKKDREWELAMGRLCLPGGTRSWLAPGTRRWAALRALAQLHVQRRGESERAWFSRCWRGDAWVFQSGTLEKHSVPVLLLFHMVFVLTTGHTPEPIHLDFTQLDPGCGRASELAEMYAGCDGFCRVHPCVHWVRSAELVGPECPLCGERAEFALTALPRGAVQARRLAAANGGTVGADADGGADGERGARRLEGSGRLDEADYDAWLETLPAAQQDALTDALASCAGEAEREAAMREQVRRRE